jgi:hypothetical protein
MCYNGNIVTEKHYLNKCFSGYGKNQNRYFHVTTPVVDASVHNMINAVGDRIGGGVFTEILQKSRSEWLGHIRLLDRKQQTTK